jgi:hypothetical protein
LIEIERDTSVTHVDIAERGRGEIERPKRDAATLERRKQRLVPFRVLVKNDERGW